MVEHFLRVMLHEMRSVRIKCTKCSSVLEVDCERVKSLSPECRQCGELFFGHGFEADEKNPFVQFGKAVEILNQCRDRVDVQFEWPST